MTVPSSVKSLPARLPGYATGLLLLLFSCASPAQHYAVVNLGTASPPGPSISFSEASAISQNGLVVGYTTFDVNEDIGAFLDTNGTMQNLGCYFGCPTYGTGVNQRGQVTGVALPSNAPSRAFLFSNGIMQDLGTLGGASASASGINDSGQVTGHAAIASSSYAIHAYLYTDGAMQDLGTLGGVSSIGAGINSHGDVTGWS